MCVERTPETSCPNNLPETNNILHEQKYDSINSNVYGNERFGFNFTSSLGLTSLEGMRHVSDVFQRNTEHELGMNMSIHDEGNSNQDRLVNPLFDGELNQIDHLVKPKDNCGLLIRGSEICKNPSETTPIDKSRRVAMFSMGPYYNPVNDTGCADAKIPAFKTVLVESYDDQSHAQTYINIDHYMVSSIQSQCGIDRYVKCYSTEEITETEGFIDDCEQGEIRSHKIWQIYNIRNLHHCANISLYNPFWCNVPLIKFSVTPKFMHITSKVQHFNADNCNIPFRYNLCMI